MILRQAEPMVVRNDPAGGGSFGARRGARTHQGVDFRCNPGALILSPVAGQVTRYGWAYARAEGAPDWRYVEVTDAQNRRHRFLYTTLLPELAVGYPVSPHQAVAVAQDISARYPGSGMLPHVHYEVWDGDERLDPALVLPSGDKD